MSKRCARCEKTVYPLEELKCLDKIWHKGCFKCQECGMTLSMKTYKGFNKMPYCEAHIPRAKATTVAETPEMRRLAENTKIQSNVQYHADFEKNKAKFTQVADDPETTRLKKNSKIISNVSYHGDLEKKAEMERKRSDQDDEEESSTAWLEVQGDQTPATASVHPTSTRPPMNYNRAHSDKEFYQNSNSSEYAESHSHADIQSSLGNNHHTERPPQWHKYATGQPNFAKNVENQYHQLQHSSVPIEASHENANPNEPRYPNPYPGGGQSAVDNHYSRQHPNGSRGYHSSTNSYPTNTNYAMQQQPNRRVGSIADYDPVNEQYGSIAQQGQQGTGGYRQETSYQIPRSNLYGDGALNQQQQQQQQQMNSVPLKVNAPPTQLGRCYRAMYDYEAADTDEVSFKDGDLIINCTAIDEGWMTGTIQRTGVTGMLPANYVERVS